MCVANNKLYFNVFCSLLCLLRGRKGTLPTTGNTTSSSKDLPPSVWLPTVVMTKSTKSEFFCLLIGFLLTVTVIVLIEMISLGMPMSYTLVSEKQMLNIAAL